MNAALRLVCVDDGPTNLAELGKVTGSNRAAPLVQELEITDALNALRQGGNRKHIGFQIRGDGATPIRIFEVEVGDQFLD